MKHSHILIRSSLIRKNSHQKIQHFFLLGFFLLFTAFMAHDSEKTMNLLLDGADTLINSTSSVKLEVVDTKVTNIFNDGLSDHTKARYYNFKGNLAIRYIKYSEALQYFEKALIFSQKSGDATRKLHTYFGFVTAYQDSDQHKKALPYVEKILNLIPNISVNEHKREALAVVANFYRSIGDLNLEMQYINDCVSLDENYSPCLLLKGNLKTRTQDLSDGLKILWTILLNDPELEEMTTVYAIQTIIFNYISVSHYEKAEELIDLLLQKTKDIGLRMTANFIALKGDLYKEKKAHDKAKQEYLKALELYTGVQFGSEILKSLYVVDKLSSNPEIDFEAYLKNRSKANEFINLDYSYDFINTLNKIIYSKSRKELGNVISFIKQGTLIDGAKISAADQEFVYDMIKQKATEFKSESIYNEYAQKWDSISYHNRLEDNERISVVMNAQLGFYEQELFKSEKEIEEKEDTIAKEKKAKREWLVYFILSFMGLVLVITLFVQSIRNRRKIEKLSLELLSNNKMLKAYAKDYEFMLITLSHHVKTPINHFHYGLKELKKLTQDLGNEQSDFLLEKMTESTSQLSSRIAALLSFIKHKTEGGLEDKIKIDLHSLSKEKFQKVKLQNVSFEKHSSKAFIIFQHKESVEIILDNIIENIVKYGDLQESLSVRFFKENESIVLEIRNSIQSNELQKFNDFDTLDLREKGSFGLGFLIIEYLCDELGIKFSHKVESSYFYTTLMFE